MRLALWGAVAASLVLSVQSAMAGNVAFAVPGTPGWQLKISGFDGVGRALFLGYPSDRVETYQGAPHYVVRVDETLLAGKGLAKWCVMGLPDHPYGVCDGNPQEAGGTYLFALPPPVPAAPEIASNDTLVCAAELLTEAGYLSSDARVAPDEGVRRAAQRFAAVQEKDPKLPALTAETLDDWCKRFAAVRKAGITALPPLLAKLHFGPDMSVAAARETAAALRVADSFLVQAIGYRLQAPPAAYISADPSWLTDGYAEQYPLPPVERAQREARFAACDGGETGYGAIFMCAKSPVFSQDQHGVGMLAQRAYALMPELFHIVQNELAGPPAAGDDQAMRHGPAWLVEGAADYVALRLLVVAGWKDFNKEIERQRGLAAKSGVTAAQIEARSAFDSNSVAPSVGLVAAYEVVGSIGPQTLPRFWQALGKKAGWQAAFETAFGITAASFYESGDRRVAEVVTVKEFVQCLQGALNSLGFNAGAVDGALGRGTMAAFSAYRDKNDPQVFRMWKLESADDAGTVCLYLAREHGLDDASEEIASRLSRQATFSMLFGADPDAIGSVALRDYGGNVVSETDILALTRRSGDQALKEVRLPYAIARDAVEICMVTAPGWVIKGNDGKNYKGNCNKVEPVLGTSGFGISYKVERGELD